jgi:hypothetical protein
MCWNPDISINTFIFSCLTLLFIYITNTYTKYKTPLFDNPIFYLLFLAVVSIQLIEFFLWRNLKNKFINEYLSKLASFVIILQQLFLILLIPITRFRNVLLYCYLLFMSGYLIYKKIYSPINFHTSVGTNGHLSWEWINYKGYENIFLFVFLFFYIVSASLINSPIPLIFVLVTLAFSLPFYFKHNTFGTMWCWISNLCLLYFLVNILLIQPYYEYNGLC